LLIESMAQSCGFLMTLEYIRQGGVVLERLHEPEVLASLPSIPMTVLVDSKIRQTGVAYPGDQIVLEADLMLRHGDICHCKSRARVAGMKIAAGEIMLAYPPYINQ
jgi:3-hydroxymyristoyl/3-hydroxydecanoyl-(acyl carrier protein) dehydratase